MFAGIAFHALLDLADQALVEFNRHADLPWQVISRSSSPAGPTSSTASVGLNFALSTILSTAGFLRVWPKLLSVANRPGRGRLTAASQSALAFGIFMALFFAVAAAAACSIGVIAASRYTVLLQAALCLSQ